MSLCRQKKRTAAAVFLLKSSKVLNYNEKSNNLILSGQKSFRSDIYLLLWHEGWSWSFKKNSLHLPPLSPYQTTRLFTNTCINWKRKLNQYQHPHLQKLCCSLVLYHLLPFESWWSTKHNNMLCLASVFNIQVWFRVWAKEPYFRTLNFRIVKVGKVL